MRRPAHAGVPVGGATPPHALSHAAIGTGRPARVRGTIRVGCTVTPDLAPLPMLQPVFPTRLRGRAVWRGLLGLLLLALLLAGAWLWRDYQGWTQAPLAGPPAAATLEVARGSGYAQIIAQLHQAGVPAASARERLYWRLLGRELGVANRLHAGEYALTPGLSPRALLQRMAAGQVVQHHFTIVDGWTFRQLRVALAAEAGLVQTLPGTSDADIARRLDIDGGKPEGWFLPETYAWVKGESDYDVLRRAHAAMRDALARAWATRSAQVKLADPYQVLILASIIEKETGLGSERAQIAGVFLRRLALDMRLQTDPTVIYGMGERYDGNIRRRDLETDTPWNTYTRAGLPPTPIALPGLPALQAATHPAPGDELYFVARGDGSHEFSPTLDAHNRAVRKYQLRRQP